VLAAAVGLVLLSPLFRLVAVAIAVTSPGPVFFRQVRVGRGGEPFRITSSAPCASTPRRSAAS
jgi:lipopolysaccharide/colanic/teichoic acid biosynthesis glycosyltransferase